jgi:chromate reductase, NAD(P)H dehydrogenase (quinone)
VRLIAFGGSNSRNSINKKLAAYAAGLFRGYHVEVLDINDFNLPLFGVDLEREIGSPPGVADFLSKVEAADMIVLSLAENNRIYSVAFKNLFDWVSRVEPKVFRNKPMLLMATSTGKRGGASVLEFASRHLPNYGADVKATFSLPLFDQNFREGEGITDPTLKQQLLGIIHALQNE